MSAFSKHVALVSKSKSVSSSEINALAAALSKQVSRDFGPIWGITATVNAFEKLHHVPVDYWSVVVVDKVKDHSGAGYHQTKNGEPFAVVLASDFPIGAAHETLEMLGDPFGRHTVAGSPPPNSPAPINKLSRVSYLIEVCDPCEHPQYSYAVNGIRVSDFVTPNYYHPISSANIRYSFTGAITHPYQVLEGGYVSFSDPASGRWYQIFLHKGKMVLHEVPNDDFHAKPVREATDAAARKFRAQYHREEVSHEHAAAVGATGGRRADDIEEALERL